MQQKFKIGILCHYPFPAGMAATIRILSYGKGLIQNGAEVEVHSNFWRGDDSPEPLEGEINGIKYIIPCRYHAKKGSLYHVFIDKANIYKGIVKGIRDSHKRKPFDYLLISTDDLREYSYFLPRIARMGIPMAFIGDEYPKPIRMLKKRIPLWDKVGLRHYHRYFRKRVLMTKALEEYYNREISPRPTFILNSVLDETRFIGVRRRVVERPYLCYMGNMQLKKDNVDNIIMAFSLIANDFPQYELHLYGTPDAEDKAFVENVISKTGLQDRVLLKGRADYDDVPQILADATILVTSQPDTVRAKGGFPTKMAEYMMSRTPMIVTDVGEIHEYVQDGVNSFMVSPEDPAAYAGKLRFILENPDVAARVAESAYEYAISNFSAKEATKGLLSFLS